MAGDEVQRIMKSATIKLPDKVMIGSQVYEVRVIDQLPELVGACDRDDKVIWVEERPNNQQAFFLNWWHEVIHAGEREYGYKLKDEDFDSDIDRIAQTVTQAVLALVEAA